MTEGINVGGPRHLSENTGQFPSFLAKVTYLKSILVKLVKIKFKIERAVTAEHRKCMFHKLDKLDAERVRLMVAAEKYAGRAPPKGFYAWSPLLEKVGQTITYWKMRLTVIQEGYVNPERLERMQKRLNIENVLKVF